MTISSLLEIRFPKLLRLRQEMKKITRLKVMFHGHNVGTKIRLPEIRCREIIKEVSGGCRELTRYEIALD